MLPSFYLSMRKSKFWLFQFVFTIDSFPFSHPEILQFQEPVTKKIAEALAAKYQESLFGEWMKIEQDPDEPCAEGGTHRETPWWSSTSSQKLTMCIHWKTSKPVDSKARRVLYRVGVPCVKIRI